MRVDESLLNAVDAAVRGSAGSAMVRRGTMWESPHEKDGGARDRRVWRRIAVTPSTFHPDSECRILVWSTVVVPWVNKVVTNFVPASDPMGTFGGNIRTLAGDTREPDALDFFIPRHRWSALSARLITPVSLRVEMGDLAETLGTLLRDHYFSWADRVVDVESLQHHLDEKGETRYRTTMFEMYDQVLAAVSYIAGNWKEGREVLLKKVDEASNDYTRKNRLQLVKRLDSYE